MIKLLVLEVFWSGVVIAFAVHILNMIVEWRDDQEVSVSEFVISLVIFVFGVAMCMLASYYLSK